METNLEFSGKTIVITGATAGIGYRTALEFCRRGAFVIGVGRSPERCQNACEEILKELPKARVHFLIADLSSQKQVHGLAASVASLLKESRLAGLDVLVNNAGLFMDKLVMTEDDIETTIAVDHIAPFLLTYLLLPLLSKSADARVITVSSDSHMRTFIVPERIRRPALFISLWQYKLSKMGNILFSYEFNARLDGAGPHAFAVDPGLVNTDIGHKGTGVLSSFIWRLRQQGGVDPIEPATTILFLAGDAQAVKSPAIYWHDSAPKLAARNATDPELARRLWEESCRLCHIDPNWEEA
jgi:NAD(P)-dependent dehydrogenase (short-subunit alcohol dehydrogenase family)